MNSAQSQLGGREDVLKDYVDMVWRMRGEAGGTSFEEEGRDCVGSSCFVCVNRFL